MRAKIQREKASLKCPVGDSYNKWENICNFLFFDQYKENIDNKSRDRKKEPLKQKTSQF